MRAAAGRAWWGFPAFPTRAAPRASPWPATPGNGGTMPRATYARGRVPEPGSVLAFRANGRMRLGHVAVVTTVVNNREIEIDHANWAGRGVARSVPVVDVSENNDWTAVRVGMGRSDAFGSIYPTYGFIYDRPDTRRHADRDHRAGGAAGAQHAAARPAAGRRARDGCRGPGADPRVRRSGRGAVASAGRPWRQPGHRSAVPRPTRSASSHRSRARTTRAVGGGGHCHRPCDTSWPCPARPGDGHDNKTTPSPHTETGQVESHNR